jgi:L-ribulose-5-phosphate 3-epimerase
MLPGFSTNSIGDTDPLAAIPFLAGLGYRSLAITLDRGSLDPFDPELDSRIDAWRQALHAAGMTCVVETGARHLLDPLVKHEPTLVSASAADRLRRVDLLERAVDICGRLGGRCVSLWSGCGRDGADEESFWRRLVDSLAPVLDRAAGRGVSLGFEPEPGMFVDTLGRYEELLNRTSRPAHLLLTLDTGHLGCMGERPVERWLVAHVGRIVNLHVDDALACRHEHLPLGAGEVDLGGMLAWLARAGCRAGLHVELPRHAHRWADTARESAAFLRRLPGLAHP